MACLVRQPHKQQPYAKQPHITNGFVDNPLHFWQDDTKDNNNEEQVTTVGYIWGWSVGQEQEPSFWADPTGACNR